MGFMTNHEEMEGGFTDEDTCEDCGGELNEHGECYECDGAPDYWGVLSDYEERMHERRQMGLVNF
jgi:hypothetical protein